MNKKMKALILRYQGRAAPYVMDDFHDALNSIGHQAVILDLGAIQQMDIEGQEKMSRMYTEVMEALHQFRPDFVMGYGATNIFSLRLMNGGVFDVFTFLGIPSVSIYYDSPLDPRCFDNVFELMDKDLTYLLVWDWHYADEMKKLGYRKTYFNPIASNIGRFKKYAYDEQDAKRFSADVSFVGSYTPKRELVLRPLLDAGLDLVIWGYEWEKAIDKRFAECNRGVADNGTELAKVYGYSKVNVNITVDQGISSLNMRVFDCIASGGFLISDYKTDLDALFGEGEVVTYRTNEELPGLVKHYLENEEERIEKVKSNRKIVLADHCYRKRAEFVIDVLEKDGAFEGPKWWRKIGDPRRAIHLTLEAGKEAIRQER